VTVSVLKRCCAPWYVMNLLWFASVTMLNCCLCISF
jgi:hypothetical protein